MRKIFSYLVFSFLFLIHGISQGPEVRTEAKIDEVYSEFKLSGEGVLTIMMDRGIDYRHPDFIDENGKTRIAYIYDLYDNSGASDTDNPYGIGTIYDEDEINAALSAGGNPITTDIFGHGTATTGIMAGNGTGVSDPEIFRGVAYKSKIISIVVTKDFVPPFGNNVGQSGDYNPAYLETAFQFANDKSQELDMPSVTLLNIGSIQDPTDGSIEFCKWVSEYTSEGNIFVCGVGDDGGQPNHLIETLQEGEETIIEFNKGEAGNLRFTGWYSEDDRFTFEIERPDGTIEGPFNPPTTPNDAKDAFINLINIYHRGKDVEFSQSDSDLRHLMIDFYGEVGKYKIRLNSTQVDSDGKLDAFLNPSRVGYTNKFENSNYTEGNINAFSACPTVISPGDYVASNQWVDINGIPRSKTGEGSPGELWLGSSAGPTMDGRYGIDFAAPGEHAFAAYGEGSYYAFFDFNVLEDSNGLYGIQNAVSAAAPLSAGVIALMLEVNPHLTQDQVKSILQESARTDAFTGDTPNNHWGYGKLDALEAIKETYNTVRIDNLDKNIASFRVFPNPVDDFLHIHFIGKDFIQGQLNIYSSSGRLILDKKISIDDSIDVSRLNSGIYNAELITDSGVFKCSFIKI